MIEELFKEMAGGSLPAVGSAKNCEPPQQGDQFVAYYVNMGGPPDKVTFEVTEIDVFEDEWEGTLIETTEEMSDDLIG